MIISKSLRLRRLMNEQSKKFIILPVDHGVSMGPIPGIEDMNGILDVFNDEAVNAVIVHKGIVRNYVETLSRNPHKGVILHLNASVCLSPQPNQKVLVSSVEEGLRLGVDGISVHINIGHDFDYRMLENLGHVSDECSKYNMPLLAMIYCRGEGIDEFSPENNAIAARVAMELGADIVKINYTGDEKSFAKIVSSVNVPVIVAGGEINSSLEKFFFNIKGALNAGASGVAVGRNVFQYHDPGIVLRGLDLLVNKNKTVKEVLESLGQFSKIRVY